MKNDEFIETQLEGIKALIEQLLLMNMTEEEQAILNKMLAYVEGEIPVVENLRRWGIL